ncbi:Alkylated DNA nucleotide flippase Atl1, participates in nucleotide excision repair, Ada-like DNA-binding domain [Methanobrevibacter olleyae]|uniref:Alkylated DNA nucleotide flippase Atl1, participates in nucleotide excision repair, Ada-like DNA-binding domain n=1 Tax=Methanobrevibacter olleyae TaxID=294671 RepID=A0A1I4JLB0_METOL|nr:MGMT family protein [Methanobrevibacter olleyae]SFL66993.1 Alkylated DNA nucleotide flippase Atl1, participates in nucleotide excision repair, Ada-like DNA-binding domain [Methanobrevibacter olleyae]
MAPKTFNEKLNDSKDMPKVINIEDEKSIKHYGGENMLIAPPLEYNEIMDKIPNGKVITISEIREFLAKKHNAEFTCPMTAGIFISLAAQASEEREDDKIPFWRTLKKDGELNPKYPRGIEYQKEMLEKEGHSFIKKGRKNIKYFVENYEDKLFNLE